MSMPSIHRVIDLQPVHKRLVLPCGIGVGVTEWVFFSVVQWKRGAIKMSKLKKCPFCGGEASLKKNYKWYIECMNTNCNASQGMAPMDEKGATEAWNRRT